MKEITVKVYSFNELQPEIKSRVIDRMRDDSVNYNMDGYNDDYSSCIQEFSKLTDIKASYEVGLCTDYVQVDVKEMMLDCAEDDEVSLEYLSGKLLFRYINNNVMKYFWEKKRMYYNTKKRTSRILGSYFGGNITGMWCDDIIVAPLVDYYYNWARYPKDFTYGDLMQKCCEALTEAWYKEFNYWYSDEGVEDYINNQSFCFLEDGTDFNYFAA